MKPFSELKKGDKLYQLSYSNWYGGTTREWDTVTIKEKRGKTYLLKGGYAWGITERMYGDIYFPSKLDAVKRAKKYHEYELKETEVTRSTLKKELKYLNNKIKLEELKNG